MLDLALAFALACFGIHRSIRIESEGAQPVNPARLGRAEALCVLCGEQALADAAETSELNQYIRIFVIRDTDWIEFGVNTP